MVLLFKLQVYMLLISVLAARENQLGEKNSFLSRRAMGGCKDDGCEQCPTNLGVCTKCLVNNGYFRGGIDKSTSGLICVPCLDHCKVCEDQYTCTKCKMLTSMNESGTECTPGVLHFILLGLIPLCFMCCLIIGCCHLAYRGKLASILSKHRRFEDRLRSVVPTPTPRENAPLRRRARQPSIFPPIEDRQSRSRRNLKTLVSLTKPDLNTHQIPTNFQTEVENIIKEQETQLSSRNGRENQMIERVVLNEPARISSRSMNSVDRVNSVNPESPFVRVGTIIALDPAPFQPPQIRS